MSLKRRILLTGLTAGLTGAIASTVIAAQAGDPQADRAAEDALSKVRAGSQAARDVNRSAMAALVFPQIIKVGFLLGGAYGEGVLLQKGRPLGYFNSASLSYGLQAGAQSFGYVLFFMNETALSYLDLSSGFEIGVGPSVVVVDQGMAKKFSSTTITQDVYGFIFNQSGLMAGLGIEGTKITRI